MKYRLLKPPIMVSDLFYIVKKVKAILLVLLFLSFKSPTCTRRHMKRPTVQNDPSSESTVWMWRKRPTTGPSMRKSDLGEFELSLY
jgi:hypothetical protein